MTKVGYSNLSTPCIISGYLSFNLYILSKEQAFLNFQRHSNHIFLTTRVCGPSKVSRALRVQRRTRRASEKYSQPDEPASSLSAHPQTSPTILQHTSTKSTTGKSNVNLRASVNPPYQNQWSLYSPSRAPMPNLYPPKPLPRRLQKHSQ